MPLFPPLDPPAAEAVAPEALAEAPEALAVAPEAQAEAPEAEAVEALGVQAPSLPLLPSDREFETGEVGDLVGRLQPKPNMLCCSMDNGQSNDWLENFSIYLEVPHKGFFFFAILRVIFYIYRYRMFSLLF